MFQYKYPQFQFKALLREEMLEQLRDYPKTYIQLWFKDYKDGIVNGCEITWDEGKLTVGRGMVYRGGNLYFMEDEYTLVCEPDNQKRYLKIQFLTEIKEPRQISGNTRIVLNYEEPDPSCEMELCRFCLQNGARLRDKHETFEDFSTDFDTVNFIHALYASEGSATLNPLILKKFAKETIRNRVNNTYDVSFAMNILANQGVIAAECIWEYLQIRLDGELKDQSGQGMYKGLLTVLNQQERGGNKVDKDYQNRKSVMLL